MDKTTIRQFSLIIPALLAMTERMTMLGISHWAEKGGSYRTVQRFFSTVIPWANVFWLFFRQHLFDLEAIYILAGDESAVTKSEKNARIRPVLFPPVWQTGTGFGFFRLVTASCP